MQCVRPARVALHTTRPSRERLQTVVFYDDRTAPSMALRYCCEHGTLALLDLIETLVAPDAAPAAH